MNTQQLFNAIDNADDKYILEILEDEPQKALVLRPVRERPKLWKIALTTAACAALVGGAFYVKGKLAALPPIAENPGPASSDSAASYKQPEIIYPEKVSLNLTHVEPSFDENGDAYPVKDPSYSSKSHAYDHYHSYLYNTGSSSSVLEGRLGDEVYAVRSGEVIFADYFDSNHGFTVIIKHDEELFTLYSYLNTDIEVPVKVGDWVTTGQTIGYLGHTPYCWWEAGMIYYCYHFDGWLPSEGYFNEREEVIDEWLQKSLVNPLNRSSFNFNKRFNDYSLIATEQGEPVYAVDDGVMEGNVDVVTIEHDNGIITKYYNLSSCVKHPTQFTEVKAGDIIGYASDSGLGYYVDWSQYQYWYDHQNESSVPSYSALGEALPLKNAPENYAYLYIWDSPQTSKSTFFFAEDREDVYAVAEGEVYFAGYYDFDRGYTVIIKHPNNMFSWYCLLNKDLGLQVQKGDKVEAGQLLGYTGQWFLRPADHIGLQYELHYNDDMKMTDERIATSNKLIGEWIKKPLVYPLNNISKNFCFDNLIPFSSKIAGESGIIPTKQGEPVYAVDDGEISRITEGCYGLCIEIKHENGISSKYFNLDINNEHLTHGDTVKAGDIIGYTTGEGLGYCVEYRPTGRSYSDVNG